MSVDLLSVNGRNGGKTVDAFATWIWVKRNWGNQRLYVWRSQKSLIYLCWIPTKELVTCFSYLSLWSREPKPKPVRWPLFLGRLMSFENVEKYFEEMVSIIYWLDNGLRWYVSRVYQWGVLFGGLCDNSLTQYWLIVVSGCSSHVGPKPDHLTPKSWLVDRIS
jgi:hypothetical protein